VGYGYAWTQLSREIRERFPWCSICGAAGVPIFLKQLGANPRWMDSRLVLTDHDNHNEEPAHWPKEFQVQQFPEAT
jgi:hypothetical protein